MTIQRELADRMLANPGTEAYGALSVTVQALADVEIVRFLAPTVFWPRPKVESAIVRITPKSEKRDAIPDLPWFHGVVRRVFTLRRKNLRRVLYSLWRPLWRDKGEVDAFLEAIDLTGDIRAEAMNVVEFQDLANALRARLDALEIDPRMLPGPIDADPVDLDFNPALGIADDESDIDGGETGDGGEG